MIKQNPLTTCIILIALALDSGCNRKNQAQLNMAMQTPLPPPQPPANTVDGGGLFLSKDPQYWNYMGNQLSRPATENEFIAMFSQTWKSELQNAQATADQLSDPDLRKAKLNQMVAAIDIKKCLTEAQGAYDKQNQVYKSERANYFAKHMGDWYELGSLSTGSWSVNDPHPNTLCFHTSAACLLPGGCQNIELDLMELDKIFSVAKTLSLSDAEKIQRQGEAEMENICWQRWGMSCMDITIKENHWTREEYGEALRQDRLKSIERIVKDLRYTRLFLVAKGNVMAGKLEKLVLLDYPTNKIVYTFPSSVVEELQRISEHHHADQD